jgi:hypothetical protein
MHLNPMQLKQGEIHATVFATAVLTGKEYALEVQINAYSLLQHLVGHDCTGQHMGAELGRGKGGADGAGRRAWLAD